MNGIQMESERQRWRVGTAVTNMGMLLAVRVMRHALIIRVVVMCAGHVRLMRFVRCGIKTRNGEIDGTLDTGSQHREHQNHSEWLAHQAGTRQGD